MLLLLVQNSLELRFGFPLRWQWLLRFNAIIVLLSVCDSVRSRWLQTPVKIYLLEAGARLFEDGVALVASAPLLISHFMTVPAALMLERLQDHGRQVHGPEVLRGVRLHLFATASDTTLNLTIKIVLRLQMRLVMKEATSWRRRWLRQRLQLGLRLSKLLRNKWLVLLLLRQHGRSIYTWIHDLVWDQRLWRRRRQEEAEVWRQMLLL